MERDEIKYAALAELGYTEEPNFSSDEDNGVNILNRAYPNIYSLALQSYDWSFSKHKEELDGTTTTGRYKYEFDLPEDLLYLRGQYSDESYSLPVYRYERNGSKLYTNYPKIYIEYTKKVCEDTLPSYFVDYLIYKLASKCCTKITGDSALLQEMITREQVAFADAKNADIKQQEVRILPTGVFTDVRF